MHPQRQCSLPRAGLQAIVGSKEERPVSPQGLCAGSGHWGGEWRDHLVGPDARPFRFRG